MLGAALLAAQAGYQLYQARQNRKEAARLQKEGPQDPTPLAFRTMQANLANQANNAQIAGYGQTVDNMNEQQASTLGEAKRAGISSSNLLNTLTRINQQRQRANRDLAIAGGQQQQFRLGQYNQALGQRGQYQEQGRQENARAVGALRGAAKQNVFNAFTSGVGAATAMDEQKNRLAGLLMGSPGAMAGGGSTPPATGGSTFQSMQNLQQNGNPNSFYQPNFANPYTYPYSSQKGTTYITDY